MKIALGADHGGYALKEAVKEHLRQRGLDFEDFGCHSPESVDYPAVAVPPCRAVVRGDCDCALLFCGTGVGISMAPVTPGCTTTPTPCAWAGGWWGPAWPVSWSTSFYRPPSRAGATSAASICWRTCAGWSREQKPRDATSTAFYLWS